MTAQEAIRFLDYEASCCRDRDAHEAFCLLLPAMLCTLDLEPMDSFEAERFRQEFKILLNQKPARVSAIQ